MFSTLFEADFGLFPESGLNILNGLSASKAQHNFFQLLLPMHSMGLIWDVLEELICLQNLKQWGGKVSLYHADMLEAGLQVL
jgi:hypothetical protein